MSGDELLTDEARDGAHEDGVDRPPARLIKVHEAPCQGTSRGTQIRHTESHDGLEAQRQGCSSIKRQPAAPDYDQGKQLVEGVSRPVKSDVRRGADGRFAGSEDGIRQVDAHCSCCRTGADVDWGTCEIPDQLYRQSLWARLSYLQRNPALPSLRRGNLRPIRNEQGDYLLRETKSVDAQEFFGYMGHEGVALQMKVAQSTMKGTIGSSLPRSQKPPMAMAQTVASKTS